MENLFDVEDSPARTEKLHRTLRRELAGWNDSNILDQFLVNGGSLKAHSKIKPVEDSARILMYPEMISEGRYPGPVRFGRPAESLNANGFSDHYPIAMALGEK